MVKICSKRGLPLVLQKSTAHKWKKWKTNSLHAPATKINSEEAVGQIII